MGTPNRARPSRVGLFLFSILWVAALGGSLALAEIPAEHSESMCGVWGCYPPLQAVMAMHLFWTVLLLGPVGFLSFTRPCGILKLGSAMLLVGLVGMIGLISTDLTRWLGSVSPDYARHWLRRIQYCLLTRTEFPVLQLALIGLCSVWLGRRQSCPVHLNNEKSLETASGLDVVPDQLISSHP